MKAERLHRILAVVLLLLFLSFQGGRTLCYHTHIFGNKIITHSHPFNNPDRQHTAAELESISILDSTLLTDDFAPCSDVSAPIAVTEQLVAATSSQPLSAVLSTDCGRAPPRVV